MEQHVDVAAGEAEGGRDVLAGAFLKHPHHDHRPLGLAQPLHAAAEADALFRVSDEGLGGRAAIASLDGVDRVVRAREMMSAALVPRGIDHDAREQRRVLAHVPGQFAARRELQERAEGVVHAVDGVFGAQPLPSSETGELRALLSDDAIEGVEDVFFGGGGHPWSDVLRKVNLTLCKDLRPSRHPWGNGGQPWRQARSVIEVDDVSFEEQVLRAEVPVLVEFVAPWCGPCTALAPTVERVAAETAGRVKVVKVDTEASPVTAARFGVRGVPTLLVLRKGERAAVHLGATTRERLMELLALE